jgi:hypothetical protein
MSELREAVINAMVEHFEDQRGHPPEQMQINDLSDYAYAVLRVLNDYVTEVRAEERQRIADKLAAVPDEVYPVDVFGGPLSTDESREANELLKDAGLPTFDRVGANAMRHAYRVASRLAREQED